MKAKYLLVSLGILVLLAAAAANRTQSAQAATIPERAPRRHVAPGSQNAPDAPPSISVGDAAVTETDASGVTAVFTVMLSNAYTNTVTVQYATADGSAQAPADYIAASGILTFPVSTTVRTIPVAIAGDLLDEADETFTLTLSNPVSATLADGQAIGTIRDNDPQPGLSINPATSVNEGSSGTVNAAFTVTLSAPSGQTVTVNYATANGTAISPGDFTAIPSTQLTYTPGQTSGSFTVAVQGDTLDEADETFTVNLSGAVNATIANSTSTGTIVDDDPPPNLSIGDVTVAEGNSGTTNAQFTVSLSAVSGRNISVQYATSAGSAQASADFTTTSGTLNIPAGQPSAVISVPVVGDLIDEDAETFTVSLNNASNAGIATSTATGTINDDDNPPVLSIAGGAVGEGNSGIAAIPFAVNLSVASSKTVTVNYATANGTAVAPGDYTAIPSTQLTFNPGEVTRNVDVVVQGDTLDEANETLTVGLSGPTNASLSAESTGTGTITDDDPQPSLSINSAANVTEGDSGTVSAAFTVTLSAPSGQNVTVNYATANATAVAPGDYTAIPSTQLTFTPGQTSNSFTVAVQGDTLDEADETFTVNLSGAANANIANGTSTRTILDDDPLPNLSIGNVSVTEGNSGTTNAQFTVSLSAVSGRNVSVQYATSAGSAQAGADFTTTSGTLNIPAGQPSAVISVPVVGDLIDEDAETFTVSLNNASNAGIATSTATGTINDDDNPPTISINSSTTVTETNGTPVSAVFQVSLSTPSGKPVTVHYATQNGSAVAPNDYTATSGDLTFSPGQTTQPVTVTVQDDLLNESSPELFSVVLSTPVNASITAGTGTGRIVDNDERPLIRISDASVAEGDSGTRQMVFLVTLRNPAGDIIPSGQPVSVDYKTRNGTATAPEDYTAILTSTLNFAPGVTTLPITVTVIGGTIDEGNEIFFVDLFNPVSASVVDGVGVGTIINDDTAGVLVEPGTSLLTTEGGGSETFTVTLHSQPVAPVTINLVSSDSSEGTVAPASLTFTSANWATPQSTVVTGVDDNLADGNIAYSVQISTASSDPKYNNLAVPAITVINADNDTAGITANPVTGLETSEDGGTAAFVMILNTQPTATVTITLSSSNPAEGILSSPSVTFTPENWDIRRTVVITGANDNLDDGDIPYTILTNPAVSADPNYSGMNPPDASVINHDNDGPAIEWVQPTTSTERFKVPPGQSEIVLEVQAAAGPVAQADIGQVRFYRWDYVNDRHISIGTVLAPDGGDPVFQLVLDANSLLGKDNQVFAVAYDHLGHPSVDQPYIFIFNNFKIYLPSVPRQP